ncbi:MAG: CBS domain-containing protein [Anaerolineales bacterium]|jgi:CBS domain-containing protein
MYVNITVKQLLNKKGHHVWSIKPDTYVLDALKMMAEKNIGAVLVMDSELPIGIFSERDYAREVKLNSLSEESTTVQMVMTDNVILVRPDQTIDECMALMTGKHIRHLPVIQDKQVIGIVSIGDVVKEIISEQEFIIEQLENYITGDTTRPAIPEGG